MVRNGKHFEQTGKSGMSDSFVPADYATLGQLLIWLCQLNCTAVFRFWHKYYLFTPELLLLLLGGGCK